MECVDCGSGQVAERPDRAAQGYRRFRCYACGRGFNERGTGVLNRAQYPSDVIALVVLWRLRYRLTLRDLAEMFLLRGIVFSHERLGSGRPSSHRRLRGNFDSAVEAEVETAAARGTLTKPTSRSVDAGATCTERSTGTAISSTPC
jgi:hypothetical protein